MNKHQVVCFDEVLWDILPMGAVPGGAPMNVAYRLQKLKKTPALITRIGMYDKGAELKKIFSAQGVGAFIVMQRGACPDYNGEELYELIQHSSIKI